MQLVINIPESTYEFCKKLGEYKTISIDAPMIANGMPLPDDMKEQLSAQNKQ